MRTIERGLTVERLREVLDYNAETGVLTWRTARGSRAPAGKPAGSPNGAGYIVVKVDNRRFLAHRLSWAISYGEFPPNEVDHINTVRNDNRLVNLRSANPSENRHNASVHRDSAVQLKGVTPSRGKFQAQIKV